MRAWCHGTKFKTALAAAGAAGGHQWQASAAGGPHMSPCLLVSETFPCKLAADIR
jgi:hypothetical protein